MNKNAVRYLIMIAAFLASGCADTVRQDEVRASGHLRTEALVLPGYDEPTEVTYKVIDGLAVMEGDIVLGKVGELQRTAVESQAATKAQPDYLWPGSIVPYVLSGTLLSTQIDTVNDAMDHWTEKTGIKFVQRTTHADYVVFTRADKPNICQSHIGRRGGQQTIDLGENCRYGTTIHEIGHALGLYHEQSRGDRDRYVTIQTANIGVDENGDSMAYNFKIRDDSGIDLGHYDYGSIMHYPKYAFAIDEEACIWGDLSKCTIVPKNGVDSDLIGQRFELSSGDIQAAKVLYDSDRNWGNGHRSTDKLGDFNGDKRTDVIQFYNGYSNVWLAKEDGSGFHPYKRWSSGHLASDQLGDFNGDGKTDVIQFYGGYSNVWLSRGSSFKPYTRWSSGHTSVDKLGDFNRDGKTDVIQFYGGNSYVWLANSAGTAFNRYTRWSSGHTSADKLGDFNGDRRTDVIQFYNGYSNVWLANSTGTAFSKYTRWGSGHRATDQIGDFNGDGKDDVIQFYNGKSYVWRSLGTKFYPYRAWSSGHTSADKLGDFNGDGRTDVVQFYGSKSYVWLAKSGEDKFEPYRTWNNWGHSTSDRVGEFNGDGKDDIIQFYSGRSYVWFSTGEVFTARY